MKDLLKTAYTFLPRRASRLLGQGSREHWRMVDLSVVELIRGAPPHHLSDPGRLESLLPQLGLCGGRMLYPPALRPYMDQGLEQMQMPNQFAPYLAKLASLKVRRYCEIGVKYGGAFIITVELLRKLCGLEHACAVDINFCPTLVKYSRAVPQAVFHQMDSASPPFLALLESGRFDAVFVDGDHEENACYRDIVSAVQHARHVVVHDISNDFTPGPARAWSRMKADFPAGFVFHEFTAQYPEVLEDTKHRVLGIGLAERVVTRAPGDVTAGR